MNRQDQIDTSCEYPASPENSKLKKKFEELKISEQPVQKKQRMAENQPPKHDCEKSSPEFLEPSEPEERCASCDKIAVNPYTAMCGHTFGTEAVKQLELESISLFTCPGRNFDNESEICGTEIQLAELILNKALHKTIQRKSVKCINADAGCTHTMMLKKHAAHVEKDCQYQRVNCPNCTELFEKRHLNQHKLNCKSKTCAFASLGCNHVESSSGVPSTSSAREKQHNAGLHMALIYQSLAATLSLARFSAKTLDAAMNKHKKELTAQEEALHMLDHTDQTRAEAMDVEELRANYVNKRVDTRTHLENYNRLIHSDFALQVAEPVFRMRNRSQYLERQEEERSEEMKKLLQDINEVPILLNHGSIIYKVTNFSEKRTRAIKGELKRGVYGPAFYTHEFGYLMVPIIYPNGDGSGAGTHLSIFIAIKKGKYDSLLRWPLVGRVTISILSQRRVGREAVRHSFRTDVASLSYHRPINEVNQASGIPKALDLNLLKQPSDYLVDDTLFIQIVTDPHLPETK